MSFINVLPISTAGLTNGATVASPNSVGSGFGQLLSKALTEVNQASSQADGMAAEYAAGGPVSVDQLMVAEQQASLALDLTVQVRDRVVSAYQTVMNMQM
ncbi:flagellar hook-basal body complex protein FliE [Alicyclobacillaceae bacterium I2511]|jgi:flagellar hook-basal body complex protein FliE|nr:flagellar hook-basal body complex protein FliE [Alicyclobacillaceae bacterium I2511]